MPRLPAPATAVSLVLLSLLAFVRAQVRATPRAAPGPPLFRGNCAPKWAAAPAEPPAFVCMQSPPGPNPGATLADLNYSDMIGGAWPAPSLPSPFRVLVWS